MINFIRVLLNPNEWWKLTYDSKKDYGCMICPKCGMCKKHHCKCTNCCSS